MGEQAPRGRVWENYTGAVDTGIAELGRVDPAAAKALVEWSSMPTGANLPGTKGTTHTWGWQTSRGEIENDPRYKQAYEALKKLGYSSNQAHAFMYAADNVRKHGKEDVKADIFRNVDSPALDELLSRFDQTANDQKAQEEQDNDPIRKKMLDFANSMMGTLDPNDPTMQAIRRNTMAAAQAYGGRAGANARSSLGSLSAAGLSENATQRYNLDRQQIGASALNMASQRELGKEQLAQGWEQMSEKTAAAKAAAAKSSGQGLGSAIGAGIGALGYLIPYAGPAIGSATMAGGAALGGYIGGETASGGTSNYVNTSRSQYQPGKSVGGGNGSGY